MIKQPLAFSLMCLALLSGCDRSSPGTSITHAGKTLTYRTTSVPYGHGKKDRGELWLTSGGPRFKDLRGCSPYFAAAPNDPAIIMCHELPESKVELVVLDTVTGDWFAIPDFSAEIGCGSVVASRDSSSILRIVEIGPDGVATLLINTATKKEAGYSYAKTQRPDGGTAPAGDGGPR